MRAFYLRAGRLVLIPIIDSQNEVYLERLRVLIELARPVIETWESFQSSSVFRRYGELPYLSKRLSYSLRKLAERLSVSEIEQIRELGLMPRSHRKYDKTPLFRKMAEYQMENLCRTLGVIQNRLDEGVSPFESPPAKAPDITDIPEMTAPRNLGSRATAVVSH